MDHNKHNDSKKDTWKPKFIDDKTCPLCCVRKSRPAYMNKHYQDCRLIYMAKYGTWNEYQCRKTGCTMINKFFLKQSMHKHFIKT